MKRVVLGVAYSNAWIALSAACQVAVQSYLLGGKIPWEPCLLGFLSMFWVYTFAKAVHFDPAADAVNDPARTAFLKLYRRPLITAGVLGLLAGCRLSLARGPITLLIFLVPLLAGLAYDLKVLPKSFPYRRLKDITGVKGLVVALAWTILTAGLSWQYVGGTRTMLALVAVWGFIHWFVNTTYFDLGDLHGDRLEGTQTIPVRFGFETTKRILHALNIIGAVAFIAACHWGLIPRSCWTLSLLSVHNAQLLVRARDEESDISFECDVLADGLFVAGFLYLLLGLVLTSMRP